MVTLICAAGASSRMAPLDKLTRPFRGSSLLRQTVEAAQIMPGPVWVALPSLDHPRADHIAGMGVTQKIFAGSAEGLSGTLRDSVGALPPETTHLCVCLADLPGIRPDHFHALRTAAQKNEKAAILRGRSQSGKPAHPTIFTRETFAAFRTLGGDQGAKPLFQNAAFTTVAVDLIGAEVGTDLDTHDDWDHFHR